MPTNNDIKLIKSLSQKKYRQLERLFVVEGEKSVLEVLEHPKAFSIFLLWCTENFAQKYENLLPTSYEIVSSKLLERVGSFQSNDSAVVVLDIPQDVNCNNTSNFCLFLDRINDPGNLGTLIRLADWYGVDNIFCSEDTVDFYNPKVISATKGSFLRIQPQYGDITAFVKSFEGQVLGAYLEGENIHQLESLKTPLGIVIGNEAAGISPELTALIERKISIPTFGNAESLNAATAAAVILDNCRRLMS
ncbi:MAG: RNA methyltransferase [Cyclobacteriaceae bacterium]|nr:RNA methyltransferase [Cyclobacteriaceae bacterium]MCH8515380.1 RNA methyltransferase [Cyclobacteriaceae bacterium]